MTYIIVDLEATCCDRGSLKKEESETIEIGAVALFRNGPEILDEFQAFIRPQRNPVLTAFCTELTSIKQSTVDQAEDFPVVIARFRAWLDHFDAPVFCSWGDYDRRQLHQDCAYHGVHYPFDDQHINIKQVFADNMGHKKGLGLERALKSVGLAFTGTAHRGIDDAYNMADLSPYLFIS